ILNRYSYADVSLLVVAHDFFLKRRIHLRMLNQRGCRNLDDDVVDTDLQIGIECVDALTHFRRAIHLDFSGEKEVRHGPERRDESLRNRLSNLTGGLVSITRRTCLLEDHWCGRGFRLADCCFDVALDDAPAWSAALQRA